MADTHPVLSVTVERQFLGDSQLFVATAQGVLDASSASDLKYTLLEHPPFPLEGHLILDLSGLSSLSPSAAGVLAALRDHVETSGHRFLMAGLPAHLQPALKALDEPLPRLVKDGQEARLILLEEIRRQA